MRSQRVTQVSYKRHTRRMDKYPSYSVTVIIIPTMPRHAVRGGLLSFSFRRHVCNVAVAFDCDTSRFFFSINYNRSFDLVSEDILFQYGNIKTCVQHHGLYEQ